MTENGKFHNGNTYGDGIKYEEGKGGMLLCVYARKPASRIFVMLADRETVFS